MLEEKRSEEKLSEEKIRSLVEGTLGQEESLACLRLLASTSGSTGGSISQLTPETFRLTADAVRAAAVPESKGMFAGAGDLIDCCGTGGSGLSHFNTSTTVAFVLAAAGLKVTKFGNRAVSSHSGSFDLLDKLEIGDVKPLPYLVELLERTNLVFLFAPQFYPTLAALAPLRKEAGFPTVFNLIGPALNPANPAFRLIGVPSRQGQNLIAGYLHEEGQVEHALVVTAASGLDELDTGSQNSIARVRKEQTAAGEKIMTTTLEELESHSALSMPKLQGKREGLLSPEDNLEIFTGLLAGKLERDNYYHALVCLNAAGAMRAAGLTTDWQDGVKLTADLIKGGAVQEKFKQYQAQFH